jgi:hypothetical protein
MQGRDGIVVDDLRFTEIGDFLERKNLVRCDSGGALYSYLFSWGHDIPLCGPGIESHAAHRWMETE